jgi:phosphoribosylanthranilate isomerase
VVDDVLRDGTPTGPNVTLLLEVCGRTSRPVIACGGVSKLDDLRQLAALGPAGVEAVIVDDALRDGAFTVAEALAALSEIQ